MRESKNSEHSCERTVYSTGESDGVLSAKGKSSQRYFKITSPESGATSKKREEVVTERQ